MMYVGGFFVDIAEISKISSVNCGLYSFWNGISLFEILTLSPILNFGLVNFMNDLLYKTDKNSLFFTSLGDFPIERFLRGRMIFNFHHDLQFNDILYILKTELLSLRMQLLFHSLLSKIQCLSHSKIF